MSTSIDESQTVVTLINVFDVESHKQNELVEVLERTAVEVMRYLNGFISSNIHRGLDGKHARPTPSGPAAKTSTPCSPSRKFKST